MLLGRACRGQTINTKLMQKKDFLFLFFSNVLNQLNYNIVHSIQKTNYDLFL